MSSHRICTPVFAETLSGLSDVFESARHLADVIELRLDYLRRNEVMSAATFLKSCLEVSTKPIIVTFRPFNQGGFRELSFDERVSFWREIALPLSTEGRREAHFFDIELDLLEREDLKPLWNQIGPEKIIASYHDFLGIPVNLNSIQDRLDRTGAAIAKLAVMAENSSDIADLFSILKRARENRRETIALAMGTAGIATRILGPAYGSYLTFATLKAKSATAAGQLGIQDLEQVYRFRDLDRETSVGGLIGSPVSHSVSPHMHNAAFRRSGINAVYVPFETSELSSFMRRVVLPATRDVDWPAFGFSVTIPYKTAVVPYLDRLDPDAAGVGAVNTIVFEGDRLAGYNTDVAGFLSPFARLGVNLRGARVAVVGAGGAARAAVYGLNREGAEPTLYVRNIAKGRELGANLGVEVKTLEQWSDGAEIIVNATPLGSKGDLETRSVLDAQKLRSAKIVYDVVANPFRTQLLAEAEMAGCQTIHGIEMLVGQAIEQFRLWTGIEAPVEVMRGAASAALGTSEISD